MLQKDFSFSSAKFQYLLTDTQDSRFTEHESFGPRQGFIFNFNNESEWISAKHESNEIGIFGICVDSYGEFTREDIPQFLLDESGKGLEALAAATNRLAGKFLILFATAYDIVILPDATASIQTNYDVVSEKPCVASIDNLIKTFRSYEYSARSIKIRSAADLAQPFPFNLTVCDEIKCLLPNYHLSVITGKVSRFAFGTNKAVAGIELDEILSTSIKQIDNIVKEYAKYYPLTCPLTSGWDSRVVFAFLRRNLDSFQSFTFRKPEFTASTSDISVPKKICAEAGIGHTILEKLITPAEYRNQLEDVIGKYHSDYIIDLAYTYNESELCGSATLNGDIMGQIGKSSIGNSLPTRFATQKYFAAKVHNLSAEARFEIKRHLAEIQATENSDSVYDIFAIENRCGRWASQNGMISSVCSLESLNIFNCRSIIERWTHIPRKLRKNCYIHKNILKRIAPDMLSFPFNPGSRYNWMRKMSMIFLLATHGKQQLLWIKKCATRDVQ